MTLRARYWLFQIVGWGGYSTLVMMVAGASAGWTPALVLGFALYFVYSIGLTEMFRQVIIHSGWLTPPVRLVWLRLAAGVVIIATMQFALVITVNTLLAPGGRWPLQAKLALAWGTTLVTASWTALYVRLTEWRRLQAREMALELGLREAELKALQRQMNPHFLFNCLNSLRALIGENPPAAQQMVTHLADLLRYNLQREPRETVPLAAELQVVNNYLALESVRLEERLRVRVDVDPAVREVPIPSMLLPTLVENAVTHGIAPRMMGGEIEVRAFRDGGNLRIDILNTGSLSRPHAGSVGLSNLHERLRLLYGDRAHLTLTQRDGDRVLASVTLPVTR